MNKPEIKCNRCRRAHAFHHVEDGQSLFTCKHCLNCKPACRMIPTQSCHECWQVYIIKRMPYADIMSPTFDRADYLEGELIRVNKLLEQANAIIANLNAEKEAKFDDNHMMDVGIYLS